MQEAGKKWNEWRRRRIIIDEEQFWAGQKRGAHRLGSREAGEQVVELPREQNQRGTECTISVGLR